MNAFIKQSAICAAMLGLCVGMASATSWEMTSAYGEENDRPSLSLSWPSPAFASLNPSEGPTAGFELLSAYGEENDLPNPGQSTLLAGNADLNEQLEATAAGIPLDLVASRFDMSRP